TLPAVVADSSASHVDTRALAQRLVSRSARIREGDLVVILGGTRDQALLEDLALASEKAGADPLVVLESDRMTRGYYDHVPAKFDDRPSEMWRRLAGFVTASFAIDAGETDTLLRGVPPARRAARMRAMQPVMDLFRRRNLRQVALGNGLYPTEERARQFGMTRAQLEHIFWRGVDVDYDALQATGERVRRVLAGGKEVRLTHPNGTDLTLRIAGRPVFVSDGVISAEDERRGGAATLVWLPAGEVFLAPVPGSANGVVVADHYAFEGRTIERLRLEFKDGEMVAMTAGSDMAALRAFYDAAPAGKAELGVLDIGINPNVEIPEGSTLAAWMPAGMVTLSLGSNDWAGGTNQPVSGVSPFLAGTTLTVDGVPLVKAGRLQVSAPIAAR
ncbi:MAG: aminopeptidase, partial [Gemmatimonadales bacterium]